MAPTPRAASPIAVLAEPPPDTPDTAAAAFRSATLTLTLAILGSSVLPVPWVFSRTGVLPGLAIAAAVAAGNAWAGTALIRAAGHLGKRTYEGVVSAAFGGSKTLRIASQLALVSLLFGNLCADAALLGDTGTLTLRDLLGEGSVPSWIANSQGRAPMLALTVLLVVPLALSRRMRSLERAAVAGSVLVAALTGVMAWSAISAKFPAVASGELPLTRFAPGARADVPDAVAILSFSFYLAPMLLPLLSEMPPGRAGQDALCRALQVTTCGIAYVAYGLLIFGAARWGLATQGDVLMNEWLQGKARGWLDAGVAVYVAISMAPMAITMRYLLDSVAAGGELAPYSWGRDAALTVGGVAAAVGVAMMAPQRAEKFFAVTGATGVCLCAYVFPVAVHFKLYFTRKRYGIVSSDAEAWLLEDASMLEGGEREGGADAEAAATAVAVIERRHSSVAEGLTRSPPEAAAVTPYYLAVPYPERPGGYPHWRRDFERLRWWQLPTALMTQVLIPLTVLILGGGTSALALYLSLSKL